MKALVKKLHAEAMIPARATEGSACFDLHALLEEDQHGEKPLVIMPGHQAIIRTGLAFEIQPGSVLLVYSRSGHGFKNGVRLSNATGVIDSDYRGEVKVALHNDGKARFTVRHGDRIAQGMFLDLPYVQLAVVDELSSTERGTGGLGSTGA